MKVNLIKYDKIITILISIVVLAFFIPIDLVKNISIAVLFLASIFSGKLGSKTKSLIRNPIFLLFIIFFLFHIIGLTYTSNIKYGLFILETRSSFIIFPLIFFFIKLDKSEIKKQLILFASLTSIVAILGLLYRVYFYFFECNDTGFFYNDNLINIFGFQAVYYAIYVNFSIFIFIYFLSKGVFKKRIIILLIYFTIVFLVVYNFLLASRMSILSLYTIGGVLILLFLIKQKKILLNTLMILGFVLLIGAMFVFFPKTVKRFESIKNTSFEFSNTNPINHFNSEISNNNWNGFNTRLAIWTCAIEAIQEHPILGSGTGDFLDDLHSKYEQNNFYFGIESNYGTHNQFLQFFLMFGVLGFIFIIIFMFYPLFISIENKKLHVVFIVLFLFAMLTEDVFSRNQGIVIFTFFSNLLVFNNPD